MLVDIVVALTDKTNADPVLDRGCIKRGHITQIEPADHQWQPGELASPNARIFTVDLTQTQIDALLAAEFGDGINKLTRRRRYALDLASFPAEHLTWPRAQPKIALNRAQIAAAMKLIA